MRQVIYRPDRFIVHNGESEIRVDRVLPSDDYTLFAKDVHGKSRVFLDPDQALRLAAYILATHPEAADSADSEDFEGLEFAPSTASCGVAPVPTFTVRPSTLPRTESIEDAGPEDLGLLHPDQDRRLAALSEVREILGPDVDACQLKAFAEWVLDRSAAAEGGEQA